MVRVIARMEILPEAVEKVKALFAQTVPLVRAEAGCVEYIPCFDLKRETEALFVTIVEAWESEELWQAHLQTPHMAAYRTVIAPLRKGNTVYALTPFC